MAPRLGTAILMSMSVQEPRLAVLDDEEQMRIAVGRLLRSHGYQVALFEDGTAFLNAQRSQPFDALILDLHMPGLSGFDVLSQLAEAPPTTPVIIVTGKDDSGNASRVMAIGASAYLVKPVDGEALLGALDTALHRAATH